MNEREKREIIILEAIKRLINEGKYTGTHPAHDALISRRVDFYV